MSETIHRSCLNYFAPPWGIPFSPMLCDRRWTRTTDLTQYDGRIHQVGALCQLSYAAYR